eukprot:3011575-Amphidinium_carterae.1
MSMTDAWRLLGSVWCSVMHKPKFDQTQNVENFGDRATTWLFGYVHVKECMQEGHMYGRPKGHYCGTSSREPYRAAHRNQWLREVNLSKLLLQIPLNIIDVRPYNLPQLFQNHSNCYQHSQHFLLVLSRYL